MPAIRPIDPAFAKVRAWYDVNRETWFDRWTRDREQPDTFIEMLVAEVRRVIAEADKAMQDSWDRAHAVPAESVVLTPGAWSIPASMVKAPRTRKAPAPPRKPSKPKRNSNA